MTVFALRIISTLDANYILTPPAKTWNRKILQLMLESFVLALWLLLIMAGSYYPTQIPHQDFRKLELKPRKRLFAWFLGGILPSVMPGVMFGIHRDMRAILEGWRRDALEAQKRGEEEDEEELWEEDERCLEYEG